MSYLTLILFHIRKKYIQNRGEKMLKLNKNKLAKKANIISSRQDMDNIIINSLFQNGIVLIRHNKEEKQQIKNYQII